MAARPQCGPGPLVPHRRVDPVPGRPRRASGSVALPVAQPISRMRSPGGSAVTASRSSYSAAGYSGRARWYRAAALSNVRRSRSRPASSVTYLSLAPTRRVANRLTSASG
jgi:hypothetical protein